MSMYKKFEDDSKRNLIRDLENSVCKSGRELLPLGTIAYAMEYHFKKCDVIPTRVNLEYYVSSDFYFVSNDEIWATKAVRVFWLKHPHSHPRITLFGLLYKKLGI
jgi:hypothetical protein